jgi:hypothetical protein
MHKSSSSKNPSTMTFSRPISWLTKASTKKQLQHSSRPERQIRLSNCSFNSRNLKRLKDSSRLEEPPMKILEKHCQTFTSSRLNGKEPMETGR